MATNREVLAMKILGMPKTLDESEKAIIAEQEVNTKLRKARADKEAQLWEEKKVEGTNDMQRKGCLAKLCAEEDAAILESDIRLKQLTVTHMFNNNTFSAQRTVANLLAGTPEA